MRHGEGPSPGLVRMMAVAAGATVANLYYCQPLLVEMGRSLHGSARALGAVPTLTQVGYALGLLLLVPLGDSHERRRVIVAVNALVSLALVAAAVAPDLRWLGAASLVLGVTTITPQLLIPMAAHLARPEARGRTVGQVTGGILIGILLSRTLAGLVGARFGWRAVFWLAAALMAALGAALRFALPRQEPTSRMRYGALLRSLGELVRDEPILRLHAVLGALTFGAFSAFWSTLALFLQGPPHHKGPATAGLYGAVGVVGALAAPLVGHHTDRRGDRRFNALGIALVLVSFPLFYLARGSLWGLGAGVVLMDLGVQANHISNQAWIFSIRPDARSRVNTVYMVTYFAGGAAGALGASWAYGAWGWLGTCAVGTAFGGAALLGLLRGRRLGGRSAPEREAPAGTLVSG